MQTKTTRAFRTISEAAEELELQPHVLRFWESKFSEIRPIKRAGGRRLYRPEDIDLLRGIKILLHEEKHPIKDVQKIIRLKGSNQVVELGRSIKRAARPRDITDTVLIPERIKSKTTHDNVDTSNLVQNPPINVKPAEVPVSKMAYTQETTETPPGYVAPAASPIPQAAPPVMRVDNAKLKAILAQLEALRSEWEHISLNTGN